MKDCASTLVEFKLLKPPLFRKMKNGTTPHLLRVMDQSGSRRASYITTPSTQGEITRMNDGFSVWQFVLFQSEEVSDLVDDGLPNLLRDLLPCIAAVFDV